MNRKTGSPWVRHGWDAYIYAKRSREAMEAAGIIDDAFDDCVACGQYVHVDELDHGYCTVPDNTDMKNTPCTKKRVFIGEGKCLEVSDKALRIEVAGEEHWIARSAFCKGNTLRAAGDVGTFIVRRWVAAEKRLLRKEDR